MDDGNYELKITSCKGITRGQGVIFESDGFYIKTMSCPDYSKHYQSLYVHGRATAQDNKHYPGYRIENGTHVFSVHGTDETRDRLIFSVYSGCITSVLDILREYNESTTWITVE